MKHIILCGLAIIACLNLSGCGAVNTTYGGLMTQGIQDYAGAKANIQKTDDMKLQAWVDTACAVNVGALQRAVSVTGNQSIANAVFTACPVPGVGVASNGMTGQMQVQTFEMPSVRQALQQAQPVQQPVQSVQVAPVIAPAPPVVLPKPRRRVVTRKPVPAPIQPVIAPAPVQVIQPVQPAPTTQPTPVIPPSGLPQGAAFP